jgi:hypothetical protein
MKWHKREHQFMLTVMRDLTMKEARVLTCALDLMAEFDHAAADPALLAGYIKDMGKASIRNALDSLLERGLLHVKDGYFTTKDQSESHAEKQKRNENGEKLNENQTSFTQVSDRFDTQKRLKTMACDPPRIDKNRVDKNKKIPKKKTPIPDGFPDAEAMALAEQIVANPKQIAREFRNKSEANGYRYVNWQAAWRNWCQNAVEKYGAPPAKATDTSLNAWAVRVYRWRKGQEPWQDAWGPEPGQPDCQVPLEALELAA